MVSEKVRKILAVFGFMIPLISYSSIFLAISISPWFSWETNALSDLGAHSGSDVIFNTGLMLAGFLYLLLIMGLFIILKRPLKRIGLIILALSAISLFSIGLFPETAGDIHFIVSVSFFLSFPIGILVFSLGLYFYNGEKLLSIFGFIVPISSLIIWFYPWETVGVTGVAIPEFLSSLFGIIWLIIYSYRLYREEP